MTGQCEAVTAETISDEQIRELRDEAERVAATAQHALLASPQPSAPKRRCCARLRRPPSTTGEAPAYLSAEHWMVRELECAPEAGELADAAREAVLDAMGANPISLRRLLWAEAEALLLGDEWTPEGWR